MKSHLSDPLLTPTARLATKAALGLVLGGIFLKPLMEAFTMPLPSAALPALRLWWIGVGCMILVAVRAHYALRPLLTRAELTPARRGRPFVGLLFLGGALFVAVRWWSLHGSGLV